MITRYDYAIMAFYFCFVIAIGVAFRRLSKNTSEYFRCGGAMPWWLTGASVWMSSYNAWTFTGAAAKAYDAGTLVLGLYLGNFLGMVSVMAYMCVRYRRLRTVTWMEAVRARYGPFTEQFYTCLKLPLLLLASGLGLQAIGVFMSSVFHVDIVTTLIVLGAAVTVIAFAGGAWAVLASDFVQMFLVVTITLVTAFLALRQPAIGGLVSLLHKLPASDFHWTMLARAPVLAGWLAVMLWFGLAGSNNIEYSTLFLMVKTDRDARRMMLLPLIGTFIGPLIFLIPPMTASITHPHLAAEYPNLAQPHEAAFVAVCLDVMPRGLLGLLLCAMMGATLTSMDAGLNKGVGVFVRSFYKPLIAPAASEKHLLVLGKLSTLVMGAIVIVIAILARYRTIGLFDLSNQLGASLAGPLLIPLVWGLFYKRTPAWSAWSTALIGFAISLILQLKLRPEQIQHWMRWQQPLSSDDWVYGRLAITTFSVIAACSAWFFFTSFFYERSSPAHLARVEKFFRNLATPIDAQREGVPDFDRLIYKMVGGLCVTFGAFVLLMTLIPNDSRRLSFVFCGGLIFATGAILRRHGNKCQ